jgi:hypothetical protein
MAGIRFQPCGARTRCGTPCKSPAMWSERSQRYTRCRLHGGASTGPKTPDGLAASQKARWKHGEYSAKVKRDWKLLRLTERAMFGRDDTTRAAACGELLRLIPNEPHGPWS